MNLLTKLLLSGFFALGPVSCSTTDYDGHAGPSRPPVPRVTMPTNLNRDEQNLIGDVEQALEESGLRPTDRAGAEYQLAFSVETSAVNAAVTLDLYQGRARVAQASARARGPRILFKRQAVIREAFDRALQEFEAQLPNPGFVHRPGRPYRQDPGNYAPPYGSGNETPNPYGQPVPDYSN